MDEESAVWLLEAYLEWLLDTQEEVAQWVGDVWTNRAFATADIVITYQIHFFIQGCMNSFTLKRCMTLSEFYQQYHGGMLALSIDQQIKEWQRKYT